MSKGYSNGYRTDEQKMRELILYVVERCRADKKLGSTKLNKILFYADFLAYLNLGESITGFTYKALPQGPVPTQVLPLRNDMVSRGELLMGERDNGGYKQVRFLALRDPDLSVFDADEIAQVDEVISDLWNKSASRVSMMSHNFIGWHFADEKAHEIIPYEVALVGNRPLTAIEVKCGLELEDMAVACLTG